MYTCGGKGGTNFFVTLKDVDDFKKKTWNLKFLKIRQLHIDLAKLFLSIRMAVRVYPSFLKYYF